MKRILIAGSGRWNGPSKVGEHHIAACLRDRGWDVGFLSLPFTPFHFPKGGEEFRGRLELWKLGRAGKRIDGVWAWNPFALLHSKPVPLLRNSLVWRSWWRTSLPSLRNILAASDFLEVDILLIREPRYEFLLDMVSHTRSVYRLADFDAAHRLSFPAEREAEARTIRSVDLVIGTSPPLVEHAIQIGAGRVELLENGVAIGPYRDPLPECPKDLESIPGPRAILVGSMAWWVDMELIQEAARSLPWISFVLVGSGNALDDLEPSPNLHVLSHRPADSIPAYLRHSQVGLLPFRHGTDEQFLDAVNPLKLHEYLAAGLPVVSTSWKEIRRLEAPIRIAADRAEFISAVAEAASLPEDPSRQEFAARRDWNSLVDRLLDLCGVA